MSVALPDSLITQREEDDPDYEDVSACQGEAPATAARARKRKTTKTIEPALSAKEEAEERVRSRRQRDFDTEQEAEIMGDSDDEGRKKERSRVLEEIWTQTQQKLLELALQQYPKGTAERWDKIAKCVPGKSKRRCSDTDNDPDRCSVAVWSLENCHTDRSPATNDAGNQGKHREDCICRYKMLVELIQKKKQAKS
ncbi:unnamed protein product [Ranitomeya imitator]|uniref:Myb-like domain-containing protein n=1 Tax=Ranitomeya imitator TaxID=111125 RepID=A0ABN9M3Q1_9NEOB|nr:unnamed protein product [Ranitomeya imitator]